MIQCPFGEAGVGHGGVLELNVHKSGTWRYCPSAALGANDLCKLGVDEPFVIALSSELLPEEVEMKIPVDLRLATATDA